MRLQFPVQAASAFRSLRVAIAIAFAVLQSVHVYADFSGSGDIVGSVDNAGNTSSPGNLIVGDTGTAGIFGDGALPLAGGDLNPLRSNQAIIGNEARSLGAVTMEDFLFLDGETDPRGGNWLIDDDLTVGNNGVGLLDLFNSSRVEVAADTRIGGGDGSGGLAASDPNAIAAYGEINVNGTGTRLVTGDDLADGFYIGFDKRGAAVISNRASIESLGFAVVGNLDGGDGEVSLTGRGTQWGVAGLLTVGNGLTGTTTAHGKISISDDAFVHSTGGIDVNSLGTVALLGGSIRTLPTTNAITNGGHIYGDGFVDAGMTIEAGGKLTNAAAAVINGPTVTNVRESLQVSGAVTNAAGGLIESTGGEMKFDSLVTNSGDIIARDSILRFNNTSPGDSTPDLINSGDLIAGGETTITGDIESSGSLVTLEDTFLLLQGNLTSTSGILTIISGDTPAPITVTGLADLSSAAIDLALTTSVSPDDGPIALLTAAGGVSLPSSAVTVFDGVIYDLSVVGNTLFATNSAVAATPMFTDFNGDGVVNALDLQIWENNYGSTGVGTAMGDSDGDGDVDSQDYFRILRDFGGAPSPLSALTAVPEPSTVALLGFAMVCYPRRRWLR